MVDRVIKGRHRERIRVKLEEERKDERILLRLGQQDIFDATASYSPHRPQHEPAHSRFRSVLPLLDRSNPLVLHSTTDEVQIPAFSTLLLEPVDFCLCL